MKLHGRVPGCQLAMIVLENFKRPPFAGQHQFGKTVAVEVAPERAADQTDVFQKGAIGFNGHELALLLAEKPRAGGVRISSGQKASSDKHVQVAVAVEIRDG